MSEPREKGGPGLVIEVHISPVGAAAAGVVMIEGTSTPGTNIRVAIMHMMDNAAPPRLPKPGTLEVNPATGAWKSKFDVQGGARYGALATATDNLASDSDSTEFTA